jgi:hypothetical protein
MKSANEVAGLEGASRMPVYVRTVTSPEPDAAGHLAVNPSPKLRAALNEPQFTGAEHDLIDKPAVFYPRLWDALGSHLPDAVVGPRHIILVVLVQPHPTPKLTPG